MSRWLLPYNNMMQHVPSLLNFPPISNPIPPLTPPHLSRLTRTKGRAPRVTEQIPTSCFTYGSVYVSKLLSIHPTPSCPHCVHKCVLCLRLHCCPAETSISTVSLDFVYVCLIYDTCFSLTYFTVQNRL